MPLYDFRCDSNHTFERFVPLEKFEEQQECACGAPAHRLISTPMFSVDNTGYSCPITGDWIGSKRQHQENLARHGCRVLETGETEAAKSRKAREEAEFEKRVEETVEREIEAMPSNKREQLHNELVNGKLDISVERASV